MRNKEESGQALLVAVLVMVVVLTVGLAVASRSITNLRTSTEEVNSQKAFSAAEAGIEYEINPAPGNSGTRQSLKDLGNNEAVSTKVISVSGHEFLVYNGNPVAKDDGADIWFSDPTYNNSLSPGYFTLYWGSPADASCSPSAAAVEIIVVSGASKATAETKRYAVDPCGRASGFASAGSAGHTIGGHAFGFKTSINSLSNVFFIRVIPLYATTGTVFGVNTCSGGSGGSGCTDLPQQGQQIDATGTAGETTRKITYFQGPPKIPVELFPAIIFSP